MTWASASAPLVNWGSWHYLSRWAVGKIPWGVACNVLRLYPVHSKCLINTSCNYHCAFQVRFHLKKERFLILKNNWGPLFCTIYTLTPHSWVLRRNNLLQKMDGFSPGPWRMRVNPGVPPALHCSFWHSLVPEDFYFLLYGKHLFMAFFPSSSPLPPSLIYFSLSFLPLPQLFLQSGAVWFSIDS